MGARACCEYLVGPKGLGVHDKDATAIPLFLGAVICLVPCASSLSSTEKYMVHFLYVRLDIG